MGYRTFFLVIAAAAHVAGAFAVNVSLPFSPPSGSQPLSQTLISFSLEQDRWSDWTGTHSPNAFTHTALQNYAQLTGKPPKIRVGAPDSEDHTFWSPTTTISEDEFPPPNTITPYPEATHIVVGDKYYELSRFLPRGTHMTWGINMGADNVTNAVNMANAIVRAFRTSAVKASGVILDLLEMGNEADYYKHNGMRPSTWTVQDYVQNWIALTGPVVKAAGLSGKNGPVSMQGASFVGPEFTPRQLFDLGLLDTAPGKTISVISQHQYSAAFCNGGDFPLVSFMSKSAVRGNLTILTADIAATKAHGLRYILGETNSIGCHGAPGVSNTAGAALWTIDYTLQAATLGIEELFFHEGIGYKYNFFQPIALDRSTLVGSPLDPPVQPHAQPNYYAGLIVNELIGKTGSSKIVELKVDDSNVSGYAAFENGRLVRAVFVNLHAWLVSSTGERPSVHIDLEFAKGKEDAQRDVDAFWGRRSATAKRLVIEHADDAEGLKWAGQSWEAKNNISPKGKLVTERVVLRNGVDLPFTEAILIEF